MSFGLFTGLSSGIHKSAKKQIATGHGAGLPRGHKMKCNEGGR